MGRIVAEVIQGAGLALADARSIVPRQGGQPVPLRTLRRWVTNGVRTSGNKPRTVRLEAIMTPNGWVTSRAAIGRFLAALTRGADVGKRNKSAKV